jgi:hypothetical protein
MIGTKKERKMKGFLDSSQHLYSRQVNAIKPDIQTNKTIIFN